MDLGKMLKQQEKRGLNLKGAAIKSHSVRDYLSDPNAARPYNINKASKPTPQTTKELPERQLEEIKPNKHTSDTRPKYSHKSSGTEATQKITNSDTEATQKIANSDTEATQKIANSDTEATHIATHLKQKKGRPSKVRYSYSMLTGNALKIVDEIYSECIINQNLETNFIEKKAFSQRVNVKIGSVRNTCVRLKERGVLEDFVAIKGPGSAWKFVLSENIYNQMCLKTKQKSDTHGDTFNSSSSSSSSSNINTTTQLPEEWKKINYSHLQEALFQVTGSERFGTAQLKIIYKNAGDLLSATDVQTSIDHFVYGLRNKPDTGVYKRRIKIASLLESLKNGDVFREPEFISIDQQNTEQIILERQDQMKEIEENFFAEKFKDYFDSLTQEERENMVSENFKGSSLLWVNSIKENKPEVRKSFSREWVEKHYRQFIWPNILEEILG